MQPSYQRFLAMLALLAGASIVQPAHAMQNEPGDFKGLVWGAPFAQHKDTLTLVGGDAGLFHYRRASDALDYGGVDLRRITYRFFDERFSGTTLVFVGSSNLKAMLAHLTQLYGPPDHASTRHRIYDWNGERIQITVACEISISCYVDMYDKALRAQESAAQSQDTGKRAD